jgi:hypothetical protein
LLSTVAPPEDGSIVLQTGFLFNASRALQNDGWLNGGEGQDKDKYLLIGFNRKGNPIEILYNITDDDTINVFHAMNCRNIYYQLIQKEESYGKND